MLSLRFDFRDLFKAPRLAFSLQRIWIMLVALGTGLILYNLFTYIALLMGGLNLTDAWQRFGILPCLFMERTLFPWYVWLVHALGVIALLITFLFANTAAARAVYMSAKGEHFYSWRQSFAFAHKKISAVLLTPVSLLTLLALMVLGSLLLGLAGKIPYAGELVVSLFMLFWFVFALLMIFFACVFWFSLFYAPAVIATTDEDAFESVFQLFSLSWNQPLRLLIYSFLSIFIALAAMGILSFFVKRSVGLSNALLGAFMGSNFLDLANNGQALVQAWTVMSEDLIFDMFRGFTPYLYFSQEFFYLPVHELARPTVSIGGYFYAISLLFLGSWVVAYGFSTLATAHTLAYLVMRKKKDDQNLLERIDKEEDLEESTEDEQTGKTGEESAAD